MVQCSYFCETEEVFYRWAQSFLVGIPKILCGFRDDDGLVVRLEDYPIKLLPKMGKNWMPNVCMNFLNQMLSYIHQLIVPVATTATPPAGNQQVWSLSSIVVSC